METLYMRMATSLFEQKNKEEIINRFEAFMMKHAKAILIEHKTMDFEACTEQNETILRAYVANCIGFDFHWTGVNHSVLVSLAGCMSNVIHVGK